VTASLLVERVDDVLVLTVDRPHRRNALDPATLYALVSALTDAQVDGTRAVVLTATGDVAFGSGMDLHALREDREAAGAAVHEFRAAFEHPERPPVVAAVNGDAMGGGFELVLRCELVVAADHVRFGLPEVSHGLVPGSGATLLPLRIPLAVAMELVLLGQRIDAARAAALGLANRVVPAHEVRDTALAIAAQLAGQAPLAVSGARRAVWAALDGRPHAMAVAQAEVARVSTSNDMREGLAAFAEKRAPRWTGT
jgi:enoyl-CoA hydratase